MKRIFRHKVYQSLSACAGGLMFASALFAAPPTPEQTEKAVAHVRARVQNTDAQEKTYRKVERDLEGYSLEGGVLTGLFKGGEIVRMTARHFGESGKATEEFYLQNGSLIFMVRTDFSYESLKSDKIVRRDQTRYYWNEAGQLLRVVNGNKTLSPAEWKSGPNPQPSEYAKQTQEDVLKFAKMLRAPAKKSEGEKDPR